MRDTPTQKETGVRRLIATVSAAFRDSPVTRHLPLAFLTLGLALALPACTPDKQVYDVVITNGRVMDPETNFDGIRNVGVKDGTIAIIAESDINGKDTIDATGHVVAPGFIEGHQHATDPFSRRVNLRDGLTTQMDFEAGAGEVLNK
jgi:urease alpha subunit